MDQELLLRNEYLTAENRILRSQIKSRLLLSDPEEATLAGNRSPVGGDDPPAHTRCFAKRATIADLYPLLLSLPKHALYGIHQLSARRA